SDRWLVFVVSGEERRREFGSRSLVAAFAGLPPRSALATFAARSTVPVTSAIAARTAVAAATATVPAIAPVPTAFTARTTVAAFARLPRRTRVGQFFARFLVDQPHRQPHLTARINLEQLDLHLL